MAQEDNLHKLYINLTDDGYNLGTEDEFRKRLQNKATAEKFHQNMVDDGYQLGSFDEFVSMNGLSYQMPQSKLPADQVERRVQTAHVPKPGERIEATHVDNDGNVLQTDTTQLVRGKVATVEIGTPQFTPPSSDEGEELARRYGVYNTKESLTTDFSYRPNEYGEMPFGWGNGQRIKQLNRKGLEFMNRTGGYDESYDQAAAHAEQLSDAQLVAEFNKLSGQIGDAGALANTPDGYAMATALRAYSHELRARDIGFAHGSENKKGIGHYRAAMQDPEVRAEILKQENMSPEQRKAYLANAYKHIMAGESGQSDVVMLAGTMIHAKDRGMFPEEAYNQVVGIINNEHTEDVLAGAMQSADAEIARLEQLIEQRTQQLFAQDEAEGMSLAKVMQHAESGSGAPIFNQRLLNDPELSMLWTAKRAAERRKKVIERKQDNHGFMRQFIGTFWDTATDINTWDFGIQDMRDAVNLASFSGNESLSVPMERARQAMLQNTVDAQEAEQRWKLSAAQRWGVIGGQALPFVAEFIGTGGGFSGVRQGVTKGVTSFLERSLGKAASNKAAQWLVRSTGMLTGDIASALLMTNTTGSLKTYSDILDRKTGDLMQLYDGTFVYRNSTTMGDAILKGEVANTLEYYTEMLGNHLDGLISGAGKRLGLSRLSESMKWLTGRQIQQLTTNVLRQGGINELPSEILEEEANLILNAMLVGDNNFDTGPLKELANKFGCNFEVDPNSEDYQRSIFNPETQADIWGGMLFSIGAMRAPSVAIGTVGQGWNAAKQGWNTANYYYYKHKTDLAGAKLNGLVGGDELLDRINNTTNEQIPSLVAGILADDDFTPDMKSLAMDYIGNLVKERGYNVRMFDNAKDLDPEQDQEEGETVDLSYQEGYNAGDEEQAGVKERVDVARAWLYNLGFDDSNIESLGGEMPEDWLAALSDEQREAVEEYRNAMAAYEGMVQHVQDDIDTEVATANNDVDAKTHLDTGAVHRAELKTGGEVFIISGHVALLPDNSIDVENSDGDLIVLDPATGGKRMIHVSDLASADEPVMADQLKQEAAATIQETMATDAANRIDGVLPFQPGDEYTLLFGEEQHTITIIGDAGDGVNTVISVDGGEQQLMPMQMIQEAADAQREARIAEQAAVAATAAQPQPTGQEDASTEEPAEDTDREYKLWKIAAATGFRDVRELLSHLSGMNNRELRMWVNDNFAPHLRAEVMQTLVPADDKASQGDAIPEQEAVEEEQPDEDAMPMNGDEVDWLATSPERGHRFLYEEAGLSPEEADAVVANSVKDAEKELEKVSKKAPKPGNAAQLNKYRAEKEAHEQQVAAAQAAVDYWKGVQAVQQQIQMDAVRAQADERAARDAAERQAAIEAEEQYQVEQAANQQEQAERGPGVVGQNIIEKWSAAPKVIGRADVKTLQDGSTVSGHYVMHEDGAMTPSHDPFNGWSPSVGFPTNEAGGTANQRDYHGDKNAQTVTLAISDPFDGRAYQDPPVGSDEGITYSGNGRTIAGMIAARNNTDGPYLETMRQYPEKYGFTAEDVAMFQHPRVTFVLDEQLPYTPEVFGLFNAQDTKGMSNTETAVALGKTVDDVTFNDVVQLINGFDTMAKFYEDDTAPTEAITLLLRGGVITPMQHTQMFDGDKVSAQGKEILENLLLGKAFEGNPNAIRQLMDMPSVRRQVVVALAEIANNSRLGEFSLEDLLSQSIDLVYKARNAKDKVKQGESVLTYAKRLSLFPDITGGASVADINNTAMLMIADILNDHGTNTLKYILTRYNYSAGEAIGMTGSLFIDESPEGILQTTIEHINNLSNNELKQQINAAVEQRKAAAQREADSGQAAADAGAGSDDQVSGENRFDRTVPADAEAARRLISRIVSAAKNIRDKVQRAVVGALTERQRKDFADQGIDVDSSYIHSVENSAIRHNQKEHGDPVREEARGQIAIVDGDYLLIPDILENYDTVEKSPNKNKQGNEVIIYVKEYPDGTVYYLEEKRDGRSSLSFETMYKKKKGTDSSDGLMNSSSPSTSMTPSDNLNSKGKGSTENANVQGNSEKNVGAAVAQAEAEVDTEPTDGQKEAGNYKKGHVKIDGFDVTIEQPKGSVRSGVDASGKAWSQEMHNTYGYIRGTEGVDGDHIDVFLSDHLDNWNGMVYVVDQVNKDGSFDEHKVMYGFDSEQEARDAYLSNYEEGWTGLGNITGVTRDEFRKWVDSSHRKTKPFAEYKSVKPVEADNGGGAAAHETGRTIQGLENYTEEEILEDVRAFIEEQLEDAGIEGVTIKGMALHGSRMRGDARPDSDLDVVVEYEGDISEDAFFNLVNYDLDFRGPNGIIIDINPITEGKSGTLEQYMERSRRYDEEKRVRADSPHYTDQADVAGMLAEEFKGEIEQAKARVEIVTESAKDGEVEAVANVTVDGETSDIWLASGAGRTMDEYWKLVYVPFTESEWQEIADLAEAFNKAQGKEVCRDDADAKRINFDTIDEAVAFERWRSKNEEKRSKTTKGGKFAASESPKKRIDDFGEKIGGARKDLARGRIRDAKKMSVKDLSALKKGADDILSQANILKLYKDGQMDEATARQFMAYNSVIKSVLNSGLLKNIREIALEKYRDAAVAWEEGKPFSLEITDKDIQAYKLTRPNASDERALESLVYHITDPVSMHLATYEALNYPAEERKLGRYVIVDYSKMQSDHVTMTRHIWVKNGYGARRGYPFDNMDAAIEKMKKLCPVVETKEKKARGEKAEHGLRVVKEGYGYYIKSRNIPGNIYLSPRFISKKQAQSYLDDNLDHLKERERRLVDALLGSNIGMAEREGVDYRDGRDVTPQDFLDEFGFRGVEFGNWVPQGERQMYLNKTYDAIKDFCAIVGISPKAFSLGGRLGLAFGARGHSKAMAHYEPAKEVINLTRMSGVGSLAHEWFHAVDNYLAKQKTGNMSDMATVTHDVVRNELSSVFKELHDVMKSMDYHRRSRSAGEYWGRTEEEFARLFENYIYNKLAAKEATSPVLVRKDVLLDDVEEQMRSSWPYPSAEENARMEPYFDRLFDMIQEKADENGNVVLFQKAEGSTIGKDAAEREAALRDGLVELLRGAGIEVVTDAEEGQRMLDGARRAADALDEMKNGWEKFFRTADGTAYGFVKDGRIYIDPRIATSETPIHEFTHLWCAALRRVNPAAWSRLKEALLGQKDVLEHVKKLYPELEGDELMDEVFAHYSGRRGAERLRREEEAEMAKADGVLDKARIKVVFDKIRRALTRFWELSRDLFAGKVEGIDKLNAEDFADMALADLLRGFNGGKTAAHGTMTQRTAPTFYSNAERAVEGVKQGKAKAEQWKAMLTKAGGIKAGEDKWMGLSQWLDEHKGETLTKEQVLEFVRQNGVQMEEVGYSEVPDTFESLKREYDQWLHDEGFDYAQEQLRERFGDDADIAFDDLGGELVVANEEAAAAVLGSENIINSTRLEYTTEGLENKREIAFVVPDVEPYQEGDEVHFGPENQGRAVMWVRFGEARDADGNRVLVIDEIQSNRHQDAREGGYRPREVDELRRKRDELKPRLKELSSRLQGEGITEEEIAEYRRLGDEDYRLKNQIIELIASSNGSIPAAPFEKNWHEVAMKRMLRLAAEEGFDKVAWTTGGQQAERYDLVNIVEAVSVESPAEDGEREITINTDSADIFLDVDKAGVIVGQQDTFNQNLRGRNISEVLGREMAERVLKGEYDGETVSGEGLRLGGEGMKGFYDQMLPRFMDKYGKRWGVKTGEVTLVTPGREVMHSVDVTPEMRRSVMEQGQPLFQKAGESDEVLFRELDDEEDAELIAELESGPTVTTYSTKVKVDGGYIPPMSSKDNETGKMRKPEREGTWNEAEERPDMAYFDEKSGKWKFDLKKSNNKTTGHVDYNPYGHSGSGMLNDQFSEAQSRPDLVVVEMAVPESEVTSGYKADKANDPVGWKPWKAGPITAKMTGTRQVMLSRWHKITREVPWPEVAQSVARDLGNQFDVLPTNTFPVQLRAELEKLGYQFIETNNKGVIQEGPYKGLTWTDRYYDINPELDKRKDRKKRAAHTAAVVRANSAQYTDNAEARLREALVEGGRLAIINQGGKWRVEGMPGEFNSRYAAIDEWRERAAGNVVWYLSEDGDYIEVEGNGDMYEMVSRTTTTSGRKQRERMARQQEARSRRGREMVDELAEKLGIKVRYVEDMSEQERAQFSERQLRSKGWYNPRTGEVFINLGRHTRLYDILSTFLHETVAHKGLRRLFGKDFNTFLDNVYNNVNKGIRAEIDRMAEQQKLRASEAQRARHDDEHWRRVATEEYMAKLAERLNLNHPEERTLWEKIKGFLLDKLRKIGVTVADSLSDNDLRGILWESYHSMESEGVMGYAKGVAFRDQMEREANNRGTATVHGTSTIAAEPQAHYTGSLFDMLPQAGAWARMMGGMSERELRNEIAKDGPNVTSSYSEEYDRRHIQEYNQACDEIQAQLERELPGEDRLLELLQDAEAQWADGAYKDERRTGVLAAIDTISRALDEERGELPRVEEDNLYRDDVNEVRKEVDDYISKYGGAEKVIINTPEDLANEYGLSTDEAQDGFEALKDRNTAAAFDHETGKIIIFVPNLLEGETEQSCFHEDFHAWLEQKYGKDVAREVCNRYLEAAKDKYPITYQSVKDSYEEKDHAEEFMAYRMEKSMASGLVEKGIYQYLNEEDRQLIDEFLETLHYDKERERAERKERRRKAVPEQASSGGRRDTEEGSQSSGRGAGLGRRLKEQLSGLPSEDDTDDVDVAGDGTIDEYNRAVNTMGKTMRVAGRDFKPRMTRYNFQEAFQDAILSVKKLQQVVCKAHGLDKLPSKEDAWTYENRLSSINRQTREHFFEKLYEPMMKVHDKLIKDGATVDGITEYVICKHGLERNQVFAERDAQREAEEITRNGGTPDMDKLRDKYRSRDYSGLTAITGLDDIADIEADAQRRVDEFEQEHGALCDELWSRINDATKWTLRVSYDRGMMSTETYIKVRDMFQYYVPLRGWDETTAEDVYDYIMGEHNSSFNATLKAAVGHTHKSDDPFATIGNMGESAIVQGNRNRLKQRLWNMATQHPTDVCQVRDMWVVQDAQGEWVPDFPDITEDADGDTVSQLLEIHDTAMANLEQQGKAKRVTNRLDVGYHIDPKHVPEHAVVVMMNGNRHVVYIQGNPRAAQAINGNLSSDKGSKGFGRRLFDFFMKDAKRYYGSVITGYSPNFAVPNFVRDLPHAYAMTFIKYGWWKGAKYVAKSLQVIPWVIKNQAGYSGNSNMDQLFREFVQYGGVTGYAHIHDIDSWKANNRMRMARLNVLGKGAVGSVKVAKAIIHTFGWFTETLELIPRFTTYCASRDMGMDIQQSIKEAKDITTNFNKKGTEMTPGVWGAVAKVLRYEEMFFNPIVQGMYQWFDVAKDRKAKMRLAGVMLWMPVMGALVPYLNQFLLAALGGGDDDDNDYFLQNEFTRRQNMLLWTGKGYAKIPIAPVFRELYGIGETIATRMCGRIDDRKMASDLVDQLRAAFSLEGQSNYREWSLARAAFPDWYAPFIDIENNENFTGKSLWYESEWTENKPEYTKAKESTWSPLVEASRRINGWLGGDDDIKADASGKWLNPVAWQHVLTNYGGGFAQVIGDAASTLNNVAHGEPTDVSQWPIAKRFYTQPTEKRANWARYGIYKQYEIEFNKAKDKFAALKKRGLSPLDMAKEISEFAQRHPKAVGVYASWNGGINGADYVQKLKDLREKGDDAAYWATLKEAVEKADYAMRTGYAKAWEQKRPSRPEFLDDDELHSTFDNSENDSVRAVMAKEIATRGGVQDYFSHDPYENYGDEATAYWNTYRRLRISEDVVEDGKASQLLDDNEKETLKKIKKQLGQGGDDEQIMDEYRRERRRLIEEHDNE